MDNIQAITSKNSKPCLDTWISNSVKCDRWDVWEKSRIDIIFKLQVSFWSEINYLRGKIKDPTKSFISRCFNKYQKKKKNQILSFQLYKKKSSYYIRYY